VTFVEALKLARLHSVAVDLNDAGDGLRLEVDGDPPIAVVEALRAAKPELVERLRERRQLLASVESARPPDVAAARWQAALAGLRAFLEAGHADEALRHGWPSSELYAVPGQWANVSETGPALLMDAKTVTSITPIAIVVRTASGATQSFCRKPESSRHRPDLDFAAICEERRKLLTPDAGPEEGRLRAIEYSVNLARRELGLDLEAAKKLVLPAIAKSSTR
jgi:hypothetical protein